MELKIKKVNKPYIKPFSLGAVFLAIILITVILSGTDKKSGNVNTNELITCPLNFYHYTGFRGTSDENLGLSWTNRIVNINDNNSNLKLLPRILPLTLYDKSVEYYSSDESIAAIDDEGNITVLKPGTVYFTVKSLYINQEKTAMLTVKRPVTGILLKNSSVTMNLSDPLRRVEVEVFPEDATNKNVKWESKDTSIALVDENGTLKPMGRGMTEIIVTTEDGGFTAKGFVTVVNKVIEPDAVLIQNKGSAQMAVGENMSMIAAISPSNSKNKLVTWTSSDEKVVSVSKSGKVKALSEGKAVITAKTSNGKTDTMEISVLTGTQGNPLNLYDKVTSKDIISTDILGKTYVNSRSFTNGGITYTSYDITLSELVDLQMGLNPPPKIWRNGIFVEATEEETTQYMNPECYYDDYYRYQFLDLSGTNNVTAEELNRFLEGKGVLEGCGQAFIDAARESNVSEIYLVAHACLETGNGTSRLAKGVEVNGTVVYNTFGIAAYDDSAVSSGSQKAYNEGWTSVEAAIRGGAKWISKWYINASTSRQNTLYKMLWNPETPGTHQYATDIGWAVKQAVSIGKIFESFPNAVLSYDIPVYEGQTAITIE